MHYKKVAIGIGMAVVVCISITAFFLQQKEKDTAVKDLESYAKEMIALCADAPHRPSCYEEEIPKLTSEISSEQIFDVIRLVRKSDKEYLFCHVLAHKLGVYDIGLDPENWLDVLASAPEDGLCSNGYTHGAALARFNDEVLSEEELEITKADFKIACEARDGWAPTDLQKAICYHGLGHVLVHLTEAEIPTSLEMCDEIGLKDDGRDYRTVCAEGVYMQLFQPLEPEDYALIDNLDMVPTRENIETFCSYNSNNDIEYGTCWRESWPLFYSDLFSPSGVEAYCNALTPEQGKDQCFITVFTINGRHNLERPEKIASLCNGVSPELRGSCFARGANAFPEESQELIEEAVLMCGRADYKNDQDECYQFLADVNAFNFHIGSEPYREMCTSLPQEWQMTCLGR